MVCGEPGWGGPLSRISVVGTGYVGLVTGTCFASLGHQVVCVDLDPDRLALIESGLVPFFEPGLEDLVRSNVGSNLSMTTDLRSAVAETELTFLTVGTPQDQKGRIDLKQVESAVRGVGAAMRDLDRWHLLVVKSTVVPGTTVEVLTPLLEDVSGRRVGIDIGIAVNPEFLTEGTAVHDFMFPDRIVVGGTDERSTREVTDVYGSFGHVPRVMTDPSTAEMIKYASNTLLSTLISYSNQISDIGSAIGGIDIVEVMRGISLSRYLTVDGVQAPITSFIAAGCGFGGSCLPKDTAALAAASRDIGVHPGLLDAVLEINRGRPKRVLEMVQKHFPDLTGVRVSVLGLAFKPDTTDVRESPAFPVISDLLAAGAVVATHDPMVGIDSIPLELASRVVYHEDLQDAVRDADAVVIITSWSEYLKLPEILSTVDSSPLVADGRNMLSPDSLERYEGIGR